jgi:hypothetical protein
MESQMKTTAISPHSPLIAALRASHKTVDTTSPSVCICARNPVSGAGKVPKSTYPHSNLLKRLKSTRRNWVRNGFEIGFFGFEIGFIGSEIGFFGFEIGAVSTA